MIRWLILAALAFALYRLVVSVARELARLDSGRASQPLPGSRPPPGSPDAGSPVELVACDVCGVHVPASRALPSSSYTGSSSFTGRRYCSEACRSKDG